MIKEALIKKLQEEYGITILNDWDAHNNRYWYIDVKGQVHVTVDGDPIRFQDFDSALQYCIEDLVDIEEN
jgi:hypothetical protein